MKKCPFIALVLGILPAGAAFADNITYTIDPIRSSLALTGTWGGSPFSAITDRGIFDPNFDSITGLIDTYTGTITATQDANTGTLQITDGSIVAQYGGFDLMFSDVDFPPNYAIADQSSPHVYGVVHGFGFSLQSPVITTPSSFDVSQVSATIISGQISSAFSIIVDLPVGLGNLPFGVVTPNIGGITDFDSTDLSGNFSLASGLGSVTNFGSGEMLIMPIDTHIITNSEEETLDLHFSGLIVATNDAPEPTTLALFLFAPLIMYRRRSPG